MLACFFATRSIHPLTSQFGIAIGVSSVPTRWIHFSSVIGCTPLTIFDSQPSRAVDVCAAGSSSALRLPGVAFVAPGRLAANVATLSSGSTTSRQSESTRWYSGIALRRGASPWYGCFAVVWVNG